MGEYPFNRQVMESPNTGGGWLSLTGQTIFSAVPNAPENNEYDESYILRYNLQSVLVQVSYLLKDAGCTFNDLVAAARAVRNEFHCAFHSVAYSDGHEEGEPEKYLTGLDTVLTGQENFRTWEIYSDPQGILECFPDDFLDRLNEGTASSVNWGWSEVYGITSLWCVDEATAHLNRGSVFKALSWLLKAERYYEWFRAGDSERKLLSDVKSDFSKQGLDTRHADNRRVRARALEIYAGKTWKSQADAARRISLEVNRTELVVMRWIRDYKKNNHSTDSGSPLPGEE